MAYTSCQGGLENMVGKQGVHTYSPCAAVFSRNKGKDKFYYGQSSCDPAVNDDNHKTSLLKERAFRKQWEEQTELPTRAPNQLSGCGPMPLPPAISMNPGMRTYSR